MKIVIIMDGGIIQSVFSDKANVKVIILDQDVEGTDEEDTLDDPEYGKVCVYEGITEAGHEPLEVKRLFGKF